MLERDLCSSSNLWVSTEGQKGIICLSMPGTIC